MNIYKDSARLDKKDILVLIPPWRSPRLIYSVMKRHIPEEFGYLDYHYSPDLVNPDAYLTKKYFLEYVDSLVSELKDLKKKKSRNFYVYAESLGTSLALVLSSKIAVKKAILIAPGDVWYSVFFSKTCLHARRLFSILDLTRWPLFHNGLKPFATFVLFVAA
jgi:hypothetical protein